MRGGKRECNPGRAEQNCSEKKAEQHPAATRASPPGGGGGNNLAHENPQNMNCKHFKAGVATRFSVNTVFYHCFR